MPHTASSDIPLCGGNSAADATFRLTEMLFVTYVKDMEKAVLVSKQCYR